MKQTKHESIDVTEEMMMEEKPVGKKEKKRIDENVELANIEATPMLENDFLERGTEERGLDARAQTDQFLDKNDLIETNLSQEFESENTIKSISKELFNRKEIGLKTEVTHDEINDITRLRFLQEQFRIGHISTLVDSLLQLRVSKDRLSRREFIESLQAERQASNPAGNFLTKFFGGGGNGGGNA